MARIIRLPKGAYPTRVGDEFAEPTTLGTRDRPDAGTRVSNLVPPMGWARLQAEDEPALSVLCEIGGTVPRVVDGYGDFDEADRPANVSLTHWRGYKPLRIELALWVDDLANGRSVEDPVDILEALAGRGKRRTRGANGAYTAPPRVIVHTDGLMPYDARAFPDVRWHVEDLDWDADDAITNDSGNRVRAPVTVMLLQAVTDDRLVDRAFAAYKRIQAAKGAPRSRRRYTVRQGDTAISIARHQLGDAGRYQEILRLNRLRDPYALHAGAVLVLP